MTPLPSPLLTPPTSLPAEAKMLEKIKNRQPLSESDITAKQNLLKLLPRGKNSGTIFQDDRFTIEYIEAPDLFKVEILNDDIDSTKASAVQWFYDNGFSQQGVCDLPLGFYLNYELAKRVEGEFNPLPEDC